VRDKELNCYEWRKYKELQKELEDKERKLLKLKMKKEELKKDLYSQKEKNEELELLVAQKEREIKLIENDMIAIQNMLSQHKKEEALRKMKEDEMLSEIKDLKGSRDRLRAQLQMKVSAGNVSKTEMEKLRAQIAELEGKPKERKNKKS
jgi:chromosome segregation ATPase